VGACCDRVGTTQLMLSGHHATSRHYVAREMYLFGKNTDVPSCSNADVGLRFSILELFSLCRWVEGTWAEAFTSTRFYHLHRQMRFAGMWWMRIAATGKLLLFSFNQSLVCQFRNVQHNSRKSSFTRFHQAHAKPVPARQNPTLRDVHLHTHHPVSLVSVSRSLSCLQSNLDVLYP
jgi:hypothetical protein